MSYSLPVILRAIASNQLARFAPGLYVKLTGQTGRGDSAKETAADIAHYFQQCVSDYLETLSIPRHEWASYLKDKVILEYGPGDIPGVALLLVAHGASKVYCVDRFPLVSFTQKNVDVIRCLHDFLDERERQRFVQCFKNQQALDDGFNPEHIEYLVHPDGLSELRDKADIVISRAVLEHVNDLNATFDDMLRAMKPGALAIHQVDLRSHGLHVVNPLDFLSPAQWLWRLMHSHKGVPNRWRANRYIDIMAHLGLHPFIFFPTGKYSNDVVAEQRPNLAKPFRLVDDEILSWQGFWIAFRKDEKHA
ncbi:methyltransferase domain-containing protein [Sulfuricystis thermophila]|uniref:methyltransferase domain-containing protein n=1 Tax=Sulfuricystis thermophila TaxID=2496847 RepID=UPI001036B89F|nr:class I SAM-dependent methyltransferase [Sulfuricystis thermophila]